MAMATAVPISALGYLSLRRFSMLLLRSITGATIHPMITAIIPEAPGFGSRVTGAGEGALMVAGKGPGFRGSGTGGKLSDGHGRYPLLR
jgi:hypothetical protein